MFIKEPFHSLWPYFTLIIVINVDVRWELLNNNKLSLSIYLYQILVEISVARYLRSVGKENLIILLLLFANKDDISISQYLNDILTRSIRFVSM